MFETYVPMGGFDEYMSPSHTPRKAMGALMDQLGALGLSQLNENHRAAEQLLKRLGATFRLYNSNSEASERILPFDPLPRLIDHQDWAVLEAGLIQRLEAIDLFLADIYGAQKIIKDGIISAEEITSSQGWRPQMQGLIPPLGRWCHISGLDLVRDGDGTWRVLEDNLRCPSGVAYFLENRRVMKQLFGGLFQSQRITPIDNYASQLLQTLQEMAPWTDSPQVVLLTPGVHNSAYFEHSYLARLMGIQLVEGTDLICEDNRVWMRSTNGLKRVDVIYRRIDDDFLDPTCFRKDSMLGVSGLMEAFRQGQVAIANAPGTGIADDKLIYAYVPQMIRYYLDEETIIPNVTTFLCSRPKECSYVLEHLPELVVKAVSEAGGYGMLIGPHASSEELKHFSELIQANPRNYIAQPTLQLSTVPSLSEGELYPCHVDLRPYILRGKQSWVTAGGLTRVALKRGSLVVNSSQGGGSKDTWVVSCSAV
ncbi:circularly permuted type 2 ATP-grasp protein [Synechococcus lacustris]|uniref:circularly permuted type 2 ATP-grasp protein n=1 Tax=Synechococcus lacustris TaxID=2116544 RepID=UPI003340EFB0